MTSPTISVSNVSKSYGSTSVLKGVNLEVLPGEVFGMLGSNGSGKSTLLRIAAGAMRATNGHASIAGTAGYVAQKFSLYEDLSVEENVVFSARCYGLRGSDLKDQVDEVLQRFDLARIRRQRASVLSHGWKQRLSLAAALCHGPAALLLDEPTAGIDPMARRAFGDIFADCARSGVAIILATHHLDEADRCDRVGYLHDGELLSPVEPLWGRDELSIGEVRR